MRRFALTLEMALAKQGVHLTGKRPYVVSTRDGFLMHTVEAQSVGAAFVKWYTWIEADPYRVAQLKECTRLQFAPPEARDRWEQLSLYLRAQEIVKIVEGGGSFEPADVKAINSPKVQAGVEKLLAKSPYQWNVIFSEQLQTTDAAAIEELGYQISAHITFIKPGSSGDVLTPWMIVHTIAHAVFNFGRNREQRMREQLLGHISEFGSKAIYEEPILGMCLFLHFRSAKAYCEQKLRNRKNARAVIDYDELAYEIMAAHIINGKTRIEPNEYLREYLRSSPRAEDRIYNASQQLGTIRQLVHDVCRNALDNCVGQVIRDT